MGYKMPIVCKEIYLPVPSSGTTFEEYKEKYGIDLNFDEFFVYDELNDTSYFKSNYKFFLVDVDGNFINDGRGIIIKGCVVPVEFISVASKDQVIFNTGSAKILNNAVIHEKMILDFTNSTIRIE